MGPVGFDYFTSRGLDPYPEDSVEVMISPDATANDLVKILNEVRPPKSTYTYVITDTDKSSIFYHWRGNIYQGQNALPTVGTLLAQQMRVTNDEHRAFVLANGYQMKSLNKYVHEEFK